MRVVLADDETEVRSALRLLLEEKSGVTLVAEAANETEMIAAVSASHPDLVLLDWELAPRGGGALLATLRATWPTLIVIVLSSRPQAGLEALAAGANAFVCKTDPLEQVLAAVREQ